MRTTPRIARVKLRPRRGPRTVYYVPEISSANLQSTTAIRNALDVAPPLHRQPRGLCPKKIDLETTIKALAALISFTAVVPQVRRLLCDHGYIQDNFKKPFDIEKIGRKVKGEFVKDSWVNHRKIFFEEYKDAETMPAIACVSDLFIIPFVGDYRQFRLWSGLGK